MIQPFMRKKFQLLTNYEEIVKAFYYSFLSPYYSNMDLNLRVDKLALSISAYNNIYNYNYIISNIKLLAAKKTIRIFLAKLNYQGRYKVIIMDKYGFCYLENWNDGRFNWANNISIHTMDNRTFKKFNHFDFSTKEVEVVSSNV